MNTNYYYQASEARLGSSDQWAEIQEKSSDFPPTLRLQKITAYKLSMPKTQCHLRTHWENDDRGNRLERGRGKITSGMGER